jgi:hypothetical protein
LRGRPRGGYKRSLAQSNKGDVMAGRFARSLALARASWSVVRADKELLWLPVLSVMALMLLVGSFVAPAVALGAFDAAAATGDPPTGFALVAFVFYVLAYFVALLAINAGLQFMILVTVLLAIVTLVVLSALQATMQGVYSAALYRHATEPGRPLAGFTPDIMAVAFKPKG